MKKAFITSLFLFIITSIIAQPLLSVKGKVLQLSDSLPVFNAHIYFEGKGIGTTSNEDGDFAFHFLEKLKSNRISISSIGYETKQISVLLSNSNSIVVYLKEDKLLLENVTVVAIDPEQILMNVAANIKQNYPQEKFSKEIYYKEAFKVNGKPIRYLEIVADYIGSGFSNKKQNPYKNDLFIKEKRPGFNNDTTFEGSNGIGVLHWLNGPKRYLKKSNFKNYNIELVGYSMYRNHEVFKLLITSKAKNKTITTIYITTDTYALVSINQWYENNDRTIPKQLFYFTKWEEYVDFVQLEDGLWYINTINDFRESLNVEGNITEIKRLVRLTNVYGEVNTNEKNRITRDTDLYRYPIPYNPIFWDTYNAPLETEDEKYVKKELNKK